MNARDAIKVAIATQVDADRQADFVEKAVAEHLEGGRRSARIRSYLELMDTRLLAREGSAELSHQEAKEALRDVYLISCGKDPEFHPH